MGWEEGPCWSRMGGSRAGLTEGLRGDRRPEH